MKVSIIGGAGRVGATAAYALQLGGLVCEVVLIDALVEAAQGEALDLLHGSATSGGATFTAGSYNAAAGSNLVMITAGLRRKPDESRLDLINRNVSLFRSLLDEIKHIRLAEGCILLVVTNPVDVLTYLAVRESGFPTQRVFGLGTMLDTVRFRSLLGVTLGVDPTQVDALILGEHGDSMVPIWSSATVNGMPIAGVPGFDHEVGQRIFEQTRTAGAEVIRFKGGAGYAVALAIREVAHALIRNRRSVLPVSTLQTGALGISEVCLSLPTELSAAGVERVLEPKLSEDELAGLRQSAEALKKTTTAAGL